MNALFPAAFAHLMPRDPLTAHAARLYAAMLPDVTADADIHSPLAYDGEDADIISRHALRVALALVAVAADRVQGDKSEASRDFAANVEKLALSLLQGEDYSSRYARSCNDDDLTMVEDACAALRYAAENIAGDEWCV